MDLEVGPDVLNEYPRIVSSTCPILFGLYLEVSRTLSSLTTMTEDKAAMILSPRLPVIVQLLLFTLRRDCDLITVEGEQPRRGISFRKHMMAALYSHKADGNDLDRRLDYFHRARHHHYVSGRSDLVYPQDIYHPARRALCVDCGISKFPLFGVRAIEDGPDEALS